MDNLKNGLNWTSVLWVALWVGAQGGYAVEKAIKAENGARTSQLKRMYPAKTLPKKGLENSKSLAGTPGTSQKLLGSQNRVILSKSRNRGGISIPKLNKPFSAPQLKRKASSTSKNWNSIGWLIVWGLASIDLLVGLWVNNQEEAPSNQNIDPEWHEEEQKKEEQKKEEQKKEEQKKEESPSSQPQNPQSPASEYPELLNVPVNPPSVCATTPFSLLAFLAPPMGLVGIGGMAYVGAKLGKRSEKNSEEGRKVGAFMGAVIGTWIACTAGPAWVLGLSLPLGLMVRNLKAQDDPVGVGGHKRQKETPGE